MLFQAKVSSSMSFIILRKNTANYEQKPNDGAMHINFTALLHYFNSRVFCVINSLCSPLPQPPPSSSSSASLTLIHFYLVDNDTWTLKGSHASHRIASQECGLRNLSTFCTLMCMCSMIILIIILKHMFYIMSRGSNSLLSAIDAKYVKSGFSVNILLQLMLDIMSIPAVPSTIFS